MEAAPTTEAVYQGVYALYNNPDSAEKEKASKWLELLQKSVSLIYTIGFGTKMLSSYHKQFRIRNWNYCPHWFGPNGL